MNYIIDANTAKVGDFEQKVAPDWFLKLCQQPVGRLVITHASTASKPVQACVSQVLYHRLLGPHKIPLTISIEVQP